MGSLPLPGPSVGHSPASPVLTVQMLVRLEEEGSSGSPIMKGSSSRIEIQALHQKNEHSTGIDGQEQHSSPILAARKTQHSSSIPRHFFLFHDEHKKRYPFSLLSGEGPAEGNLSCSLSELSFFSTRGSRIATRSDHHSSNLDPALVQRRNLPRLQWSCFFVF